MWQVCNNSLYLEDLLYKLFDALLVVDSSYHFDADLWNLGKIWTFQADVLQNLDDSFPHTYTSILERVTFQLSHMEVNSNTKTHTKMPCPLPRLATHTTHQDPCRNHVIVGGEDLRPRKNKLSH